MPQSLHCTALSHPSGLFPQRIAYGKSKSDAIAKLDGTYIERKKKKTEEGELLQAKSCSISIPPLLSVCCTFLAVINTTYYYITIL